MVTGIEAAGLVLGAFPIVIEGLKFYIDSAKKAKEISRHKYVLRQFVRDIETEMTIFVDTWYYLTGYDPSQVTAGKLPQGCIAQIPTYLRPKSIISIRTVCESMLEVLEDLQKKIEKYTQREAGYLKMLHVTFSLTSEYRAAQLALIRRYNTQFRELVTGAQATVATETKMIDVAKHYRRVCEHALLIYNVLKENLGAATCACSASHTAYLQLDIRSGGVQKEQSLDLNPSSFLRFSLVFSVPFDQNVATYSSRWRELEFEHLENSADKTSECTDVHLAKTEQESIISVVDRAMGMTEAIGSAPFDSSSSMLRCDIAQMTTDSCQRVDMDAHAGVAVSLVIGQSGSVREKFKGWVQGKMPTRGSQGQKSQNTSPMTGSTTETQSIDPTTPIKETENLELPHGSLNTPYLIPGYNRGQSRVADNVIPCLCTTIRNFTEACHPCLGILVSSDDRQHRVWVPTRPLCITGSAKSISLAEMLHLPEPSRQERLKLGVKLASSVMQLHKTEWWRECWSKQDIKFFVHQEPDGRETPLVDYPFLHQNFKSPNTGTPDPLASDSFESSIIPFNPRLFSLGLVLIELWYWKGLESLEEGVASAGPSKTDCGNLRTADYHTALRLAKRLSKDAGANYGEAVRRCIHGLDTWETSLENDVFKNKVYAEILHPLETNLETFFDKSLAEIFNKHAL